ncbi:MAG: TIGR02281 family clan AA aspartic protease [Gammaproteobacteria bacterium]|nr:TIGR02281 family clan AA aspartic protease [Gammaproteobacteria bacterium]
MNTKKIGQGMFAATFVLGIALLTVFFGGVEKRQRNPNQDPESVMLAHSVEVDLKRNRKGHYVVTGTINSHPVELLLDTGATDVVVPEALADRLGLRRGRAGRAMTANGSVTVYETNINRLKIGDILLSDVRASINPAMPPPAILLGMSALGRVEFVQSGDSLTLKQFNSRQ